MTKAAKSSAQAPASAKRNASDNTPVTVVPRRSSIATAKPRATPANGPAPSRPDTKLGRVVAMLRTTRGATIDQLVKATDWQRHTVRGAIAGAIKKKLGLSVLSEKRDGVRVYRIAR